MNKSIYKGTCQVCGSVQRLHNGSNTIYNHGFTRSGGFGYWTSAPCWGSNHQPLQISCDIVEDTIRAAYDQRDKLIELRTAQEEETGDLKHFVFKRENHETLQVRAYVSNYSYKTTTWGNGKTTYEFLIELTEYATKEVHEQDFGRYNEYRGFLTEDQCLQIFRDNEIDRLNIDIKELNLYAREQSEVLDNWVAKPLIKI